MCKKNVLKWRTFEFTGWITGKRLKIDGYMLRCVWQALNPLSTHVTFTAIIPGAYQGEAKMWLQKLTRIPLAISVLLVYFGTCIGLNWLLYLSVLDYMLKMIDWFYSFMDSLIDMNPGVHHQSGVALLTGAGSSGTWRLRRSHQGVRTVRCCRGISSVGWISSGGVHRGVVDKVCQDSVSQVPCHYSCRQ